VPDVERAHRPGRRAPGAADAAEALGLRTAELARLAKNAVDASFLGDAPKALLKSEINEMTLPDPENFA
jgi:aminodeoxyfutalosine deaminase